jgi:DNA transformation protein
LPKSKIQSARSIYFKVGTTQRRQYEESGSHPFTYQAKGKTIALSYWQVPEDVVEDTESLMQWAEQAYQESLSGKQASSTKKNARKKSS